MASSSQEPSLNHEENHLDQECLKFDSFDFPYKKISPEKNLCKTKELKDCINEPDNIVNISTSNLDVKNKINFDKSKFDESKAKMESVDLSDLTFSCNDFILGDCDCFEQASQLVDPALKDSESTPFSFNNSDSVQLFKFSFTENSEDNLSNSNNLSSKDCSCDIDGNENVNDHCNFYRVFELLDSNMNVNMEKKNQINESVQCKKNKLKKEEKKRKILQNASIKKGRRYLPNFKQKVLEYTKNHTFKETALHFNINCNTITEWSRDLKLSLQHSKASMPGSDYNKYKTDIVGTPESKTEIIFETDFMEPSLKIIEDELPRGEMKPDERFMKWMEMKRSQKKKLSRTEVYHMGKSCLRKCPLEREKPSWFVFWLKRFNKALKNSTKPDVEAEKYIKYPNRFKVEVVLYARIFSKNLAARVFNVPRRRMFDWFKFWAPLEDSLTEDPKLVLKKNEDTKKDKIRSKIYSELHLWYQKMVLNGARPTTYEIKSKGREIFSSYGIACIKFSDGWLQKFCQRNNIRLRNSEDEHLLLWVLTQFDNNVTLSHQEITEKSSLLIGKKKFKGSKGWTLRFLKRHKNLLQCNPTVEDQLPQIVQEKLTRFWDNFRQSMISHQIGPDDMGCMDEIPLNFSYPGNKSNNLPLLRKTGFENCQGVVILCALGNGRILPPTVVFKGSGPKQLLSERNLDILIMYQEKGLITPEILESWFKDIWLSCTQSPNALVVDSFQPHCAIQLRQLSTEKNCMLHIIPEGCSSRFQPLGVETTPMFKECIKKQWKEFTNESGRSHSIDELRKYRCPDRDRVLHWVQNAYEKIKRNPMLSLSEEEQRREESNPDLLEPEATTTTPSC